ncbi:hypothetical protein AN958_07220 [Leucoagaricus sp. SymC.cos]|nr:hypothetical protein AN958_07220 [Leucoagaricus sp. SymC.cos]
MDVEIHCVALSLVFLLYIQKSLDSMKAFWNNHQLQTEHYLTPTALYKLSKQAAITQGYWNNNSGDDLRIVTDKYGCKEESIDSAELADNCIGRRTTATDSDWKARAKAQNALSKFDFSRIDGNNGIDIYCEVVIRLLVSVNSSYSFADTEL